MDWWNDLTDWTSSDEGWRVLSGAVIPFVAIIVAGVIAALIGRGATKRVVALQEREAKNAAVAAIISAARKAGVWGSLGHDERRYADHLAEDADIRLRLLPVTGAPLAANWAQHEIADIKKNSSTFSFQADQSLAEFRDRLLEWQARPGRARKLFKADLERWKFESPDPDADLIERQQDWNADRAEAPRAQASAPVAPADTSTPTTTSLRPAQRPSSGPASAPSNPVPTAGTPAGATAGTAAAGTSAAGTTAAGTPAASAPSAAFSVGRGGPDQNATRSFGENTTRVYGDDAAPPVRPALGNPVSPSRSASGDDQSRASDDTEVVDDPGATRAYSDTRAPGGSDRPQPAGQRDQTGRPEQRDGSERPVASPTAAESHVNRAPANDLHAAPARGSDARGVTSTTSGPSRPPQGPAASSNTDDQSEATYTQPISAAELRRRASDDDE